MSHSSTTLRMCCATHGKTNTVFSKRNFRLSWLEESHEMKTRQLFSMHVTSAPFIVPSHEHDVVFTVATVTPLIFLTVLLPEIPRNLKAKQLQYVTRGFAIIFGFSAMTVSFLQLAGESTKAGTITALGLLGATALSAACGMAWPILVEFTKSSALLLVSLVGGWLYLGLFILFYFLRVKTTSDKITFWVFVCLSTFVMLTVIIRFQLLRQKADESKASREE